MNRSIVLPANHKVRRVPFRLLPPLCTSQGNLFSAKEISLTGERLVGSQQVAHHPSKQRVPGKPWWPARVIRCGRESLWLGSMSERSRPLCSSPFSLEAFPAEESREEVVRKRQLGRERASKRKSQGSSATCLEASSRRPGTLSTRTEARGRRFRQVGVLRTPATRLTRTDKQTRGGAFRAPSLFQRVTFF